jgi:signal transduction histidine kinase
MEKMDAAVVVPSFVQDRLLGFVVLGDKKSKRLYTESDLDTLTTLANQSALAIENCIFLSEFENQQIHFFQTAKMADLGTMASGISHQVNNRFNTIGAGAEYTSMMDLKQLRKLMGEKDLPELKPIIESLEDTMKKIRDDAMKGGEIATNLLRFSKKSEGFQAVDLDKAMQTCIRLWGCKRDLSLIDFENSVSPDLPKIRGNFSQVEEVLFNLLDNAFDATLMKKEAWELGKRAKPEGEWKGKVSVSARPLQRENKSYIEITIQDNGIGMDATARQHIFLPFFTTKGANKGTGLGLYVMKRIVEAHEGEIQVDSKDGVGTTFRVFFHQMKEADKKL